MHAVYSLAFGLSDFVLSSFSGKTYHQYNFNDSLVSIYN